MEPNADQTQRYTVKQAAELLGISPEAVRSRLNRGTLKRETGDDGTVYVLIRTDHTVDQPTDQSAAQALMLERLDSEVRYLREQLQVANERDREQRRIIAALTQHIPELPSAPVRHDPSEATQGPQDDSDSTARGTAPTGPQATTQRRSWWQRLMGS